jgi:hypothetical protein
LSDPAKNLFSGKDKVLHRIIPDLFSIWKLQVIPPPGNGNESLALAEFFQQNDFMTFSFVRHPFDRYFFSGGGGGGTMGICNEISAFWDHSSVGQITSIFQLGHLAHFMHNQKCY